jgi:hypothetical protein
MVFACYVAFAALGWFLNGFGSILPDLEEHIGSRATIYPLMPGAVMLVSGIVVVRRHRTAPPRGDHHRGVVVGSVALAMSVVVMGVTRWQAVSLLGALAAAIAAAYLVRLLPAALATIRPADTERVMMRSNAYSSVAAISAPLAIGASIALGLGWLPGMVVPLAIAAIAVGRTARPTAEDDSRTAAVEPEHVAVPPLATWWREWAVLTLSIVVEFCFVYFAATYLHDELGLSTAAAAAGAAAWGIGMSIGRFAVSTWPPPRTVIPSAIVIAAGFVMLWGVAVPAVAIAGIGIAGLGASPLYPSRMTVLLERFPGSPAQGSARGSLASGVALVSAPALMAGLREAFDVRAAYLAVPVLLAVLLALAVHDVSDTS